MYLSVFNPVTIPVCFLGPALDSVSLRAALVLGQTLAFHHVRLHRSTASEHEKAQLFYWLNKLLCSELSVSGNGHVSPLLLCF